MNQSLYIPIDQFDETDKIVQQIKTNLNDRLISEMKYIIKEYNKRKRTNKDVGKIKKKNNNENYVSPSLIINFD